MVKDVRVGVEEGDGAAVRDARPLEEVARTGAHVEVPVAQVPPVPLGEPSRRAPPRHRREEAEDHGVVDLEEEWRVLALALVGGVVTIYGAHAFLHPHAMELVRATMASPPSGVKADGDPTRRVSAWRCLAFALATLRLLSVRLRSPA